MAEPANAYRLAPSQSLQSFTLKPPSSGLFPPFFRSNLRVPHDRPFTMVLSTGAAHTLALNDDSNGNVAEPDHVVESIAGHLSRRMLEHYFHIRLKAK